MKITLKMTTCATCGKSKKIMKRCTSCRNVLYCSKECQMKNWPDHRKKCSLQTKVTRTPQNQDDTAAMQTEIEKVALNERGVKSGCKESVRTPVVVKCNHRKHKIDLMDVETKSGTHVMKQLSQELRIPLNSLKIVGKGKLLSADNIKDILIISKCRIFQAFGEEAEEEDGLDSCDIEAIMERLHVGRNEAIKSLRSCNGDLIDAILELGNKM